MSLHGLSRDAWKRYTDKGNWDYQIMAPGYKYNLTDIAAAIGIHQLERAETMRRQREEIAQYYLEKLSHIEEMQLPPDNKNRILSWHLFPIRLNLSELSISRNQFIEELKQSGIGYSVHWRPLHLHPYYCEKLNWCDEYLPTATELWSRLISLPIFPSMTAKEIDYVIKTVEKLCMANSKRKLSLAA